MNLDARSYRYDNCLLISWVFQKGTLSMALNPSDQPGNLECRIDKAPVATGEYSQTGELLHLGRWSAVAW